MARHMIRYFEHVGQPHIQWMRKTHGIHALAQPITESKLTRFKNRLQHVFNKQSPPSLADVIAPTEVVLLLIADDQIESFILQNPCLNEKKLVHFSGALYTEKAQGCHPLMTFGAELYSADFGWFRTAIIPHYEVAGRNLMDVMHIYYFAGRGNS